MYLGQEHVQVIFHIKIYFFIFIYLFVCLYFDTTFMTFKHILPQTPITVMQKTWKDLDMFLWDPPIYVVNCFMHGPSLGMTDVDPTPIASHTVSDETIESEYTIWTIRFTSE